MDRWTEIELFVQVAETGSLSRAAEVLHGGQGGGR